MQPRKTSDFPLDKPFEKLDPTTSLAEVGLRLVQNFDSGTPKVIGTATVLSGHLLITAKHVLSDLYEQSATQAGASCSVFAGDLVAVQIVPGHEYVVWNIVSACADPVADIVFLQLSASPRRSDRRRIHAWKLLRVSPYPPAIGDRVAAFGYRRGIVQVSRNEMGGRHIDLNDEPMMSVGVVQEIFEERRDRVMLPFPCYQVSARFDGGMSGGPVFDETGSICGLVCASVESNHSDFDPISYVSTLWPLFRIVVQFDRGGSYPRGVSYSAIELASDEIISVADLPRLLRWFSERMDCIPSNIDDSDEF